VSAGLSLLALALAYWLIDVAKARVGAVFFICVGMNPLFIYLFALSGGGDWFRGIAQPFTMGFAGWIGEASAQVVTGFAVWGLLWALCYWLYRREIFIKI
jgi:predicted acyltransferase